ncbi:MAG: bifunctional DNA primase/polymerase [Candidatus Roizmanbacteria bacterium]|nr:bifunctional DNA primase/polymerase [Candidatus Roizmanbacteria bacterium]
MNMQDWALAYLGVGWNVFPLLPKSKVPHGKLLWETGFREKDEKDGNLKASWKPLQKVRVTEELVNEWWEQEPTANIGLICGKISGVTVIDIDTKKDYKDWESPDNIKFTICEPTLTSVTGSGGLHLFCKWESNLKNSQKRIHKQIDIKNDGGYVVLPPSIHDKTGNTYAFDPMFPFNEVNVEALAHFPLVLKKELMTIQTNKTSNLEWKYILEGVHEKIDGRNNTAVKLLGKCLNSLFIGFNSDPVFLPFLWEFIECWNKRNKPPLKEHELKQLFESIVTKVL